MPASVPTLFPPVQNPISPSEMPLGSLPLDPVPETKMKCESRPFALPKKITNPKPIVTELENPYLIAHPLKRVMLLDKYITTKPLDGR